MGGVLNGWDFEWVKSRSRQASSELQRDSGGETFQIRIKRVAHVQGYFCDA